MSVTLKEKVDFVCKYMPGDLGDIAMMIPCHVHTLRKMRSGKENVQLSIKARIDALYDKAKAIQEITENA